MPITIRDANPADNAWVLSTNNDATPAVNQLEAGDLERLISTAEYFRIAETEGRRAGFLLALREWADYQSPNFLWFKRHYDQFLYIDRVVIAKDSRRLGVGRVFYADIVSYAEQSVPVLTCEVNLRPPNPGSVLFHSGFGFAEVGRQETEGGEKEVSLLALDLPSYEFVRTVR